MENFREVLEMVLTISQPLYQAAYNRAIIKTLTWLVICVGLSIALAITGRNLYKIGKQKDATGYDSYDATTYYMGSFACGGFLIGTLAVTIQSVINLLTLEYTTYKILMDLFTDCSM